MQEIKELYLTLAATGWAYLILICALFVLGIAFSKRLRCLFIFGGHKMHRYNIKSKGRQGWMTFEAERCMRCGIERIVKVKTQGRKK